jgi:hypothetical protein
MVKRKERGDDHPENQNYQYDGFPGPGDLLGLLGHGKADEQCQRHDIGEREVVGKTPCKAVGVHVAEPGVDVDADLRRTQDERQREKNERRNQDISHSFVSAKCCCSLL